MIDNLTAQRFWFHVNKESRKTYEGTPRWEWKEGVNSNQP